MIDTKENIEAGAQDYFNYIASQLNCNYQLNSVMQLEGRINERILNKAIRLLIKEEPVLGCRLTINDEKPSWEPRSDLDDYKLCSVKQTDSVEESVLNFVNRPIHEGVDPLFIARIFRSPDSDTLCFKLSHSCSDGRGTKDALERLNSIYNALVLNPSFDTEAKRGTRSQEQIFQNITEKSLIHSWFDDSTANSEKCVFPYFSMEYEKGQSALAVQYLPKEEFRKIRLRGKKYGATANDLMITALFRALWRLDNLDEAQKTVLGCTVDLRQYLPKKGTENICNLSSLFPITALKNISESFAETLKQVVEATKRQKQSMLGPNFPLVHEIYARLGFKEMVEQMTQGEDGREGNAPSFIFSNVGVMGSGKMKWDNTAVHRLYITGPAINPPASLIVATTYEGELALTCAYSKHAVSEKAADAFLRLIVAEMLTLL